MYLSGRLGLRSSRGYPDKVPPYWYTNFKDVMIPYTLTVYILLNGLWVSGDNIDGWGSVDYPTKEECMERASFSANVAMEIPEKPPAMIFECSEKRIQPFSN